MIYGPDNKPIQSTVKVVNPGPAGTNLTGLNLTGGFVNPDRIGIRNYKQVKSHDETFSYAVEILSLAVLSRMGEYTHPSRKISDYINEQIEGIYGSFFQVIEDLMSAVWAGFSLGEMVVNYNGGFATLLDIQAIDPEIVTFVFHEDGPFKNRVKSVKLGNNLISGLAGNPIDIDKFVLYSHCPQWGNPYGTSRFQALYHIWYIKNNVLPLWPKALERFAMPFIIMAVKNPTGKVTVNGQEMTALQYAALFVEALRDGAGVAVGDDKEIKIEGAQGKIGTSYYDCLEYCNKMIFRGMWIPPLVVDKSDTGAYSQGKVHFDTFLFALDKLKQDITEVIIEQLFRRLITWNFGPQKKWGEFQHKEFKVETAKLFSEIVDKATTNGYITPDRFEDAQAVREELGLPGITQSEHKKQVEEKEQRRQEIQKAWMKGVQDKKESPEDDGQGDKKADKTKASRFERETEALLNGLPSLFI